MAMATVVFATGIDASLAQHILKWRDTKFTATELDAMNGTPGELLPAPESTELYDVVEVVCNMTKGVSAFELGSGTLDVRYNSGSGSLIAQFANAFLESDSAIAKAYGRDMVSTNALGKKVVLYPSADVTAGSGSLACRVYYRKIDTSDI